MTKQRRRELASAEEPPAEAEGAVEAVEGNGGDIIQGGSGRTEPLASNSKNLPELSRLYSSGSSSLSTSESSFQLSLRDGMDNAVKGKDGGPIRGREEGAPSSATGADARAGPAESVAEANGGVDAAAKSDRDAAILAEDDEEDVELPPEFLSAPRITADEEALERHTLTSKELLSLQSDVSGVLPPEQSLMIEGLKQVEHMLELIPPERKCALLEAQRAFPFLTTSSSHAKMILANEEFDAQAAARRLVLYWDRRRAMHGGNNSDGDFAKDCCVEPPSDEDMVRIVDDWDVDKRRQYDAMDPVVRDRALSYVTEWQSQKEAEMDKELAKLSDSAKAAWNDARSVHPDLADSGAHRSIFLRSVEYDPALAARRMLNYWELKYRLFGKERAFGPITVEDLEDALGAARNWHGGCFICCQGPTSTEGQ